MAQRIVIRDISVDEFQQFRKGVRFSVQIKLEQPPIVGQFVILQQIKTKPPTPGPQTLNKRISTIINFAAFLSSTDFYSINFD